MNIIIVGCGRVGQTLAEKLNGDGNDVTVIDSSQEKIKRITNRLDVMGFVGNGATHSVQREAGIKDADLFIAVTNSDELNLLCCLIAKKEGNCQTIARVKNPDYSQETSFLKEELGLAMVINPEYAAAEEIARVLRFPSAITIEPFAKGRVELIKFRMPKDSMLIGMSVRDAAAKFKFSVLICTIERGEETYIANGDFIFGEKDVVSIVASPKQVNEFFRKINYKEQSVKDALIVGGGGLTHYLCEILDRSGIALKIIEKDRKVCEELASKWQRATVIHGNTAEREILQEHGIEQAGSFVALSALDEENILLSLFAKEAGAKKIVTKINRIDYDNVISRLDLDTVICPKNITSDLIVRHVRAMQNAQGSNVERLYNIIQGQVEAAEFIVKEGSPIAGKPLKDLHFKKNVLVAAILRKKTVILPRGDDTIETGDSVVVVTKEVGLQDVADVLLSKGA